MDGLLATLSEGDVVMTIRHLLPGGPERHIKQCVQPIVLMGSTGTVIHADEGPLVKVSFDDVGSWWVCRRDLRSCPPGRRGTSGRESTETRLHGRAGEEDRRATRARRDREQRRALVCAGRGASTPRYLHGRQEMDESLHLETLSDDELRDELEQVYLIIAPRHVEARGYCLYFVLLGAFLTASGLVITVLRLTGAM